MTDSVNVPTSTKEMTSLGLLHSPSGYINSDAYIRK